MSPVLCGAGGLWRCGDPLGIAPVPAVRGFVQSANLAERLLSGRSGGGTVVAHWYILKGYVIIGKIVWFVVFVLFFFYMRVHCE